MSIIPRPRPYPSRGSLGGTRPPEYTLAPYAQDDPGHVEAGIGLLQLQRPGVSCGGLLLLCLWSACPVECLLASFSLGG